MQMRMPSSWFELYKPWKYMSISYAKEMHIEFLRGENNSWTTTMAIKFRFIASRKEFDEEFRANKWKINEQFWKWKLFA